MNIKLSNLTEQEIKELLPKNLILLGYRGSLAHGAYNPKSEIDDKDIMGVFINDLSHYFGLNQKEHHEKFIKEWDAVSYELKKFVKLLCKSNPNVLSLLWLEKQDYIYIHPIGQKLIENRELFVTKQAYHSFNGYAYGQLRRMEKFHFEGYMGEKRKRLVEKFGYDCKNASHLIRLLEMGIEYLTEGKLYVKRKNSQKLLAIKNGEWSLDRVKEEADKLFTLTKEAYIKSSLPNDIDYEKINELLIKMYLEYFKLNK